MATDCLQMQCIWLKEDSRYRIPEILFAEKHVLWFCQLRVRTRNLDRTSEVFDMDTGAFKLSWCLEVSGASVSNIILRFCFWPPQARPFHQDNYLRPAISGKIFNIIFIRKLMFSTGIPLTHEIASHQHGEELGELTGGESPHSHLDTEFYVFLLASYPKDFCLKLSEDPG